MHRNYRVTRTRLLLIACLTITIPAICSGQAKTKQSKSPEKKTTAGLAALQERKQAAMSLVENALAGAVTIEPVEYKVLTQIEAAALLWQSDQARAISVLKSAMRTTQELLKEQEKSELRGPLSATKGQRLYSQALRKIAAISPGLIREVALDQSSDTKPAQQIVGRSTEEARAIISAAADQIETNPALAARMAEQSMSYGMASWQNFLTRLAQKDNAEAERLAILMMVRLRDNPVSHVYFANYIQGFVFAQGRSSRVRDFFFSSMSVKLRRMLLTPAPAGQEPDLFAVGEMARLASAYSGRWQREFERIAAEFEVWFRSRSLSIPAPPSVKVKNRPPEPAPTDTQEIAQALPKVAAITSARQRNDEYQKLAVRAALSEDLTLAESILSKISDESVRREATTSVYTPGIRLRLKNGDWAEARKLALLILDPLGRTLAMEKLAVGMRQARQEKPAVIEIYRAAITQLENDQQDAKVGKAFLLISKSLLVAYPEENTEALNIAIAALNRLADSGKLFENPHINSVTMTWVNRTNVFLRPEELIDLPDMLGQVFKTAAKQDTERALSMAAGLSHLGLRSLAQLAVSKEIFGQTKSLSVVPFKKI